MILKQNTTPTIVSEGLESSMMGINANKIGMLSRILRDSIYSDKIGGCVREYTTNIFDEHKKHGIEKPAEIGIRQENGASIFYARDFAKGLSEHDIRNVFGMYLESTKNNSNESTGMFGIGSKIFLSYTDTFYIVSHFEGVKTTYIATLDAGDEGESISKILKISEEPTDESGIEISAEIKRGDTYKFDDKIRNFITYCSMPIVGNCSDKVYVPQTPKQTKNIGDYIFKVYEQGQKKVVYRMGNITYKTESLDSLNPGTNLIIEIPIGKMSIPVSREAFEETRANQRILEEIKGYIQELENQDMESFARFTVDDLIKDKENTHFIGQIFTCKKTKVFPETAQFISSLRKTFYGENTPDFEKFEGKTVIGIIPNNKAKDMWMDRLMAFSKEQNKQYWSIADSSDIQGSFLPQMIFDYFVFKKVKSKFFPMKKAETGGKKDSWIVCEQRGGRNKSNIHKNEYTALELHNEARKLLKLEEAEDLEEAALQMQDMVYNTTTELHMFTINSKNDYGSSCPYWWTASPKLRDQLKAIGWFMLHEQEYKDIVNRLHDIERKKHAERQLVASCYPSYIVCQLAEKRKAVLPNRIRRAEKIAELIQTIKSENSLRGRMLQSFGSNYYAPKMTRHEFRQIMKLSLTNNSLGV